MWWDDVFATHKIPLILFFSILQSLHVSRHFIPFQTSRFICLPFIQKYDPLAHWESIIFLVPISLHNQFELCSNVFNVRTIFTFEQAKKKWLFQGDMASKPEPMRPERQEWALSYWNKFASRNCPCEAPH